MLGAFEHEGHGYVLVPRRPPSQPWIEVSSTELGGAADGLSGFLRRLEARSAGGGGYREAVRTRRQDLPLEELRGRIAAHDPVPGALEVPSTVMLGVSYPGLGLVQGLAFLGIGGIGYAAVVGSVAIGAALRLHDTSPLLLQLIGYVLFIAFTVLAAWTAVRIGKHWKEAKNRTLPRQRVLVLAPDGCIVGFTDGVQTLAWSEIGLFAAGHSPNGEALAAYDPTGQQLGRIDASWLDAPLPLVVRVAETYRAAALDD